MTGKQSFFVTLLLYGCAFLLCLEWLYPAALISDNNHMSVFILYAVFCFAISIIRPRWWVSLPLKAAGLVLILDQLFLSPTIFSSAWLQQGIEEISFNLNALLTQQWGTLTPLFRNMLFLLLIWMLSYLLYYWFIILKRVFLFSLLTIVYLSLLDTFTLYDADVAIVRALIVAFFALGIANLSREASRESIRLPWVKKIPAWGVPLAVVILLSALLGYAAPKLPPQWPDPVPFLNSAAENASEFGADTDTQKVGYGDDDTRLGGSFVQDEDTVIFRAEAEAAHYWRVETKDVYTGKGWKKSEDPQYDLQPGKSIDLDTFSERVPTQQREATLTFSDDFTMEKLVYPYGVSGVKANSSAIDVQVDRQFGAIRPEQNSNPPFLKQYTVDYNAPSFVPDVLREADPGDDPDRLKKRYTQLPDSLPERVGELATEITEADNNRYDKAASIETYFGESGYTYQTSNVPVPDEDQDYVDQFLFDSQAGYCDNYSTSMVVMLRSLGIPARWAKGFTSGEIVEHGNGAGDDNIYEVTSAHAHSWVEVYFPGSGWVSFEPTQGFSNLADFQEQASEANENEALPDTETPDNDQSGVDQTEDDQPDDDEATQPAQTRADNHTSMPWGYMLAGVILIGLLAFVVYKTRFRWLTAYVCRRWQRRPDDQMFQKAYHHLLALLAHHGVTRRPDQTLRAFAEEVDSLYHTTAMQQLTAAYEPLLYRDAFNHQDNARRLQLWQQLIKQIQS